MKQAPTLLITNAHLLTLEDAAGVIPAGAVYIEGERIVEVGQAAGIARKADRTIDAGGRAVMPGLINAHHHLYSTFARGFAPPGPPPHNFTEILEGLWWKLDAALDIEDVYFSALLAAMECARAGCTTLIDHHASPGCADGSLDAIEQAVREVGLSACLCYEVTDRNVIGEGIAENERFIRKCQTANDPQITALFGLHALMTLGDRTLERCAASAQSLDTGFHVHAAEDPADVELAMQRHGQTLMGRFEQFGIPGPQTIFAHGTHFSAAELERLAASASMLVNNPESNMNNGLEVAPTLDMLDAGVLVGLGTDGMSSHMISQARALYLHQRTTKRDPNAGFAEACEVLLQNNRTIAGRVFDEPRGTLAPGQLADIVIPDYVPFTPLTADNVYGHLLFGLGFAQVNTTIARGQVIVEDGRMTGLDEAAIRARCTERARRIWGRIE
jgi:putative selenium metabolism protein SsnA